MFGSARVSGEIVRLIERWWMGMAGAGEEIFILPPAGGRAAGLVDGRRATSAASPLAAAAPPGYRAARAPNGRLPGGGKDRLAQIQHYLYLDQANKQLRHHSRCTYWTS